MMAHIIQTTLHPVWNAMRNQCQGFKLKILGYLNKLGEKIQVSVNASLVAD